MGYVTHMDTKKKIACGSLFGDLLYLLLLEQGVGQGDPKLSLPTSVILSELCEAYMMISSMRMVILNQTCTSLGNG